MKAIRFDTHADSGKHLSGPPFLPYDGSCIHENLPWAPYHSRRLARNWPPPAPPSAKSKTLTLLAEALPDDYSVYHAVHWTNLERGYSVFGEIDFIVMNRAGNLLVIEQKSGFLDETPEGLVKRYPGRSKSVVAQLARNVDALHSKLNARPNAPFARFDYLFYCPDYQVKQPHTAGLTPERIVDAMRRDELPAIIRSVLPAGEASPEAAKVHRFLRDIVQLETDVSALIGQRAQSGHPHFRRAGALGAATGIFAVPAARQRHCRFGQDATGAGRIPGRHRAGLRPLYLCYNRPLADHFQRIAPTGGLVCTLHMPSASSACAPPARFPISIGPDAFDRLCWSDAAEACRWMRTGCSMFVTVIDRRGPGFHRRLARPRIPPSAAARSPAPVAGRPVAEPLWPKPGGACRAGCGSTPTANFRSPRSVVRMLQNLLPEEFRIEAASPRCTTANWSSADLPTMPPN
jgi:hypothetical protein